MRTAPQGPLEAALSALGPGNPAILDLYRVHMVERRLAGSDRRKTGGESPINRERRLADRRSDDIADRRTE